MALRPRSVCRSIGGGVLRGLLLAVVRLGGDAASATRPRSLISVRTAICASGVGAFAAFRRAD